MLKCRNDSLIKLCLSNNIRAIIFFYLLYLGKNMFIVLQHFYTWTCLERGHNCFNWKLKKLFYLTALKIYIARVCIVDNSLKSIFSIGNLITGKIDTTTGSIIRKSRSRLFHYYLPFVYIGCK